MEDSTKKIGVIGAGVMGTGVAHSVGQAGYAVVLLDLTEEKLEHARQEIYQSLRFQTFFKKGEGLEEPESVISRIIFSTDYHLLKDADYVIENVPEKQNVKTGGQVRDLRQNTACAG